MLWLSGARMLPAPVGRAEVRRFSTTQMSRSSLRMRGRAASSPRLTKAKTIGGGDDGGVVALRF